MTNIASSARLRLLGLPSSTLQTNSSTVAALAIRAMLRPRRSGSSMLAAAMLNSSIIAMPALAEGRAWVIKAAAMMSAATEQNTIGCSHCSLRPQASSARAITR